MANLSHASSTPELLCLVSGILQTLFDLNSIVGPNQLAHDDCVTDRGVKSLMASSLAIEHVFANDPPVPLVEGGLPENLIGMDKAVEDEPGFVSHVHMDACITQDKRGVTYS